MLNVVKKIFGSSNDRQLRPLYATVDHINALEEEWHKKSDAELKKLTTSFRQRLKDGETEDDILPEAFATVREAARRTLKQRHYDVQLLGGIVLHQGRIAEMRTGEGKTLVSTLAAYLNALSGKGVHLVTVNDYLAQRDAEWMGQVHRFLGLTVSCIVHGMNDAERKEAYQADITYATNNELGFDFLRDNMKFSLDEMVQRPFNYAIIDEVDSILIDEARTPLIISGPVEDQTDLYVKIDALMSGITREHYELDEKQRTVTFNDHGINHLEKVMEENGLIEKGGNLFDLEYVILVHHANQALRAHTLFTKDKDYIVKENKVVIIDEFTGRMMEGRRYSEGLHQALEAKEQAPIQRENQTLASVTFQNYFRQYPKLSGMTGTAQTEAAEFDDIYKLQVIEIPTHKPVARLDDDDAIYRTEEEKYQAIIDEVKAAHKANQPVLIGTASIEQSEFLSTLLKKEKIKHNVLNARQHEKEAYVIAQAGQPGTVTVATNMAGRGTDIQLGGNAEMLLADSATNKANKNTLATIEKDKALVKEAGGLYVIGTERHESRRIDNQLRGRSGRQGDPGRSKFFLSTQDDLIRIFGADKKMDWVMSTLGEPGEPITHPMITRMMEKAQMKVETRNYEIRKNLLKFDDVMNDQRSVIYDQRRELMETEDCAEIIKEMAEDTLHELIENTMPKGTYLEQWKLEGLQIEILRIFGLDLPIADWAQEEGMADDEMLERIQKNIHKIYHGKMKEYGEDLVHDISHKLLLFTLDELWKDHLHTLDQLRQGINLRAYGQKDPLNEYKREAFQLFEVMLDQLREVSVTRFYHMHLSKNDGNVSVLDRRSQKMEESRLDPASQGQGTVNNEDYAPGKVETVRYQKEKRDPSNPKTWGKVGRNENCPCNSGKKFKHCHGKI